MATEQRKNILCDLCEYEQALSFCGECMCKLDDFCKLAHTRQKRTKVHPLAEIESIKLHDLSVSCSLCNSLSERYCQECDVCLCTKCADSHHQLNDVQTSTAHTNTLRRDDSLYPYSHNDSSNTINDSPASQPEVCGKCTSSVCDLCDEVQAVMYCGECRLKLGEFCQLAHTKQKLTKKHHLIAIPDYFNVRCSSCNEFADKVCSECAVHLCSKCAGNHHKLGDTLATTTDKPCSGGQDKNKLILDEMKIDFTFQMKNNEKQCSGKKQSSYGQENNITDRGKKQSLNRMTLLQQSQRRTYQLPLTASESGEKNTDNDHVTDNQRCDQVAGCSKMLAKDNYMFSTFEDGHENTIERPGKPTVIRICTDSVDIIWTGLHDVRKGDVYQVRIENTITGKEEFQDFETNSGNIRRLQQGTTYVFNVRLVCANGDESQFSDNSEEVTTHTSYASKIISKSVLLKKGTNGPDLYRLPMIERIEARSEYLKKFDIGPVGIDVKEKTIMLVGATGTGKSTFVDAIANYVMGVMLDDTFRFTVMQEDRAKQQDQAVTNTETITCYSFNSNIGTVHSGRLNVVDTPGFGDQRGPDRDEAIVKQFQKLFDSPGEKGIQMIDAICIFSKATAARLTPTQTYILNAIMSMFGNDIVENMCTMITFNDGDSVPPVMAAVTASGLPFGKEFTFNNLAITADPNSGITSQFWDKNLDSFSRMFTHLDTLETKSMQLTKYVLKERQVLTLTCQKLVKRIKEGISALQVLKAEIDLLQQNQNDINKNKNYTYEITEVRMVKQTGYAYDLVKEKVQKTFDEMMKKYQEAKGKQLILQQIIEEKWKELVIISADIERMLEQMKTCNNRLKEIALRPNSLGLTDQLDLMILTEQYEGKEGYQKRIEVLKEFRERAAIDELVQKFKTEESLVTARYNALHS